MESMDLSFHFLMGLTSTVSKYVMMFSEEGNGCEYIRGILLVIDGVVGGRFSPQKLSPSHIHLRVKSSSIIIASIPFSTLIPRHDIQLIISANN